MHPKMDVAGVLSGETFVAGPADVVGDGVAFFVAGLSSVSGIGIVGAWFFESVLGACGAEDGLIAGERCSLGGGGFRGASAGGLGSRWNALVHPLLAGIFGA
jgi:hypothetical protein